MIYKGMEDMSCAISDAEIRIADNCDELVNADSMADRKAKMREIADCFICLPGSYGTLDEMMDVVAGGKPLM